MIWGYPYFWKHLFFLSQLVNSQTATASAGVPFADDAKLAKPWLKLKSSRVFFCNVNATFKPTYMPGVEVSKGKLLFCKCRGWKFQKGNRFFAKRIEMRQDFHHFSAHDEQHRCLKHLHPLVVSSHLSPQRRDSNRHETCTTFNAIIALQTK